LLSYKTLSEKFKLIRASG